MNTMLLGIIIFVITYIFIASEKVDKTIAAMLGAGAMAACGVASFPQMLSKVDLNVLALLVGMMVIVNIMATTGVFEWIAVKIAQQTKGNGILVTIEFLLATAVVSAFMDNVTTVILMAPVTILITQLLGIPTVPILILEAIFSNIGGTATLVGDPPNILIGASCGLSFNDFLFNLTPAVVIIMAVVLILVVFFLRKQLATGASARHAVSLTDASRAILESKRLRRAMVIFVLVLVGFLTGNMTGIEPGLVAICGAFLMTLVCGLPISHMLEKVEWTTILFFCGLFMVIGALEINGVFTKLGELMVQATNGNFALTMMVILWAGAILSAVVDNIPLVIAMIPLINSIIPVFAKNMYGIDVPADYLTQVNYTLPQEVMLHIREPLFWSLALGACLGGNGTLIGASANVVICQIARKNRYSMTFGNFTAYGAPIMLVSVLISSIYLYIRYIL